MGSSKSEKLGIKRAKCHEGPMSEIEHTVMKEN